MSEDISHAWDADDGGEEAFDLKMEEWAERDWATWLEDTLSFPFVATREDDDDDAIFTDVAEREPFRQGHKMETASGSRLDKRQVIHALLDEFAARSVSGNALLKPLHRLPPPCIPAGPTHRLSDSTLSRSIPRAVT